MSRDQELLKLFSDAQEAGDSSFGDVEVFIDYAVMPGRALVWEIVAREYMVYDGYWDRSIVRGDADMTLAKTLQKAISEWS